MMFRYTLIFLLFISLPAAAQLCYVPGSAYFLGHPQELRTMAGGNPHSIRLIHTVGQNGTTDTFSVRITYEGMTAYIFHDDAGGEVQQFRYDVCGNPLRSVIPYSRNIFVRLNYTACTYRYQGNGRLKKIINRNEQDKVYETFIFRYDQTGHITRVVNSFYGRTDFFYSADGELAYILEYPGHGAVQTIEVIAEP